MKWGTDGEEMRTLTRLQESAKKTKEVKRALATRDVIGFGVIDPLCCCLRPLFLRLKCRKPSANTICYKVAAHTLISVFNVAVTVRFEILLQRFLT